jgi:hypothetical protein
MSRPSRPFSKATTDPPPGDPRDEPPSPPFRFQLATPPVATVAAGDSLGLRRRPGPGARSGCRAERAGSEARARRRDELRGGRLAGARGARPAGEARGGARRHAAAGRDDRRRDRGRHRLLQPPPRQGGGSHGEGLRRGHPAADARSPQGVRHQGGGAQRHHGPRHRHGPQAAAARRRPDPAGRRLPRVPEAAGDAGPDRRVAGAGRKGDSRRVSPRGDHRLSHQHQAPDVDRAGDLGMDRGGVSSRGPDREPSRAAHLPLYDP